jgi:hypothetical protein
MENSTEISALADLWGFTCDNNVPVKIKGNEKGIFVNDHKIADVEFNNIQLRFTLNPDRIIEGKSKHLYIVFDGRSGSNLTIKQMYEKLKPFLEK